MSSLKGGEQSININRDGLPISDFDFIKALKDVNANIFFRLIHEEKGFAENQHCVLSERQYAVIRQIFEIRQTEGYGIYMVAQNGGQQKKNIKSLSSHVLDFDCGKYDSGKRDEKNQIIWSYRTTSEIEEHKEIILTCLEKLPEASIINETKNGFHVYWRLDQNYDILKYRSLELALCDFFDSLTTTKYSDRRVADLPHVFRVPSFLHLKNPNDPYVIKTIKFDPQLVYSQKQIADSINVRLSDLENDLIEPSKGASEPSKAKESIITGAGLKTPSKPVEVNNYADLLEYLRSKDLREFLGTNVAERVAFNCLFHNDKHPSAVITFHHGVWKYFCNSSSCDYNSENGLDIIDIVQKQKGYSFNEAIDYLCTIYNIIFLKSKWAEEQRDKYVANISFILNDKELKKYPSLDKVLRTNFSVLNTMLNIGLSSIRTENLHFESDSLFFTSNRFLAAKANRPYQKVNQYINLYAVLGLIVKVPQEFIPSRIAETFSKIAKKQKQKMISFYTIPNFFDVAKEAERRAKELISKGFSIKAVSYKYFKEAMGEKIANLAYPNIRIEFENPKQELVEVEILKDIFAGAGYSSFRKLEENESLKQIPREQLYAEFRRLIPRLLTEHYIHFCRANKELKERFNLDSYIYILFQPPMDI